LTSVKHCFVYNLQFMFLWGFTHDPLIDVFGLHYGSAMSPGVPVNPQLPSLTNPGVIDPEI